MSSWKQIECGPCSLSSQYGSYTASLCFIVKQPGAVRGSVETRGEEGREVERCAGWAALIRSRETPPPPPLHPPPLAASNGNLSCQWQLLKAAGGFGDIMFDFFQISTRFFFLCVCCCRRRLLLALLIKVATISQCTVNNYTPGDIEHTTNRL